MTQTERRALMNARVTLDGHPAIISGALADFPVVRRLDGKGGSVEFAWNTVANIVNNHGGAFRS